MKLFQLLNQKFRDISVERKTQIIFLSFLLITLLCYGIVFYFNSLQKSDSRLVDLAVKNRMVSQRIGAMAEAIESDNEEIAEKAKEELIKSVREHELALITLKDGGFIPGFEHEFPASKGVIRAKITEIQNFFVSNKKLAGVLVSAPKTISQVRGDQTVEVPNPVFWKALKVMQRNIINGNLLNQDMDLTDMFVEKANQTKSNFFGLLVFLLALNLGTLIGGYRLLCTYVTLPARSLAEISTQIANGDAGVRSKYSSGDDIGKISEAINILTENLRKAACFTMKLGKGEFDAILDLKVSENTSEEQNLALALLNMKENLVGRAETDNQRKWIDSGLARFSELIRNHQDIKSFSEMAVTELVKQVNGIQAGIFIAKEKENKIELELTACYAYDRRKMMEKTLLPGEGLVGQAYLEKDVIYLLEIPEDYYSITTGLGAGNPKCIFIMPLKNNDQVEGVFEIASINKLNEFQVEFLKKAAENMGSSLHQIKANERTRKLLEESQQQGEELRAQEEEMRQNMEELAATQEEIARKESQYIQRIEELEAQIVLRNA